MTDAGFIITTKLCEGRPYTTGREENCTVCNEPCWVSFSTMLSAGADYKVICMDCFESKIKTSKENLNFQPPNRKMMDEMKASGMSEEDVNGIFGCIDFFTNKFRILPPSLLKRKDK